MFFILHTADVNVGDTITQLGNDYRILEIVHRIGLHPYMSPVVHVEPA